MKLAVIGSRSFTDYELLAKVILENFDNISCIVSGGAVGADALAKQYALDQGIEYLEYKPDWNKYGRAAGVVRNTEIIKDCDAVIACWDGSSKGTKDTIKKAKKQGKVLLVLNFTDKSLGKF